MHKYAVVIFALIACVAAKPGLLHAPLAAPLVAAPLAVAPVVTATSHQVVARNHNGIAHAPLVAAAPINKFVAPLAAPLSAPIATPFAAPIAAAPLHYAAQGPLFL